MQLVFTVGHSAHSAGRLFDLLRMHGVTAVADVRSQPYSRIHPQFNREALRDAMKSVGMSYVFLGRELGARSEDPDCYYEGKALYDRIAQTGLFHQGLQRIAEGVSRGHRIALLCAEKDPLTCHRTILVTRHLVARGFSATHILDDGRLEPHEAALDRLLEEVGLREHDLFKTRQARVDEAYARRGAEIAYVDKATPHRSVGVEHSVS